MPPRLSRNSITIPNSRPSLARCWRRSVELAVELKPCRLRRRSRKGSCARKPAKWCRSRLFPGQWPRVWRSDAWFWPQCGRDREGRLRSLSSVTCCLGFGSLHCSRRSMRMQRHPPLWFGIQTSKMAYYNSNGYRRCRLIRITRCG